MAAEAPATESGPPDDLPQVFGRYLLIKRLSRGGMGEIFLGRVGEIQGFEKPVIIKKVLPGLAANEDFVKRFIDEAQVAIKLSHANIASVFEVGKVDGDYFLALEYIEGRDLRRLLGRCRQSRERIPQDICLLIARELANGLGYAHRRTDADGKQLALVHCDISPPNVMVSFEGEVKIIDFGIAKSAIRIAGTNPNMGFGKFGYMAPEQLVRGGVIDRRSDIYAAGVVLYELLTGERLFTFPEGADYRQMARTVTKGEFIPASQRAPGIDPSIDPLLSRALAAKKENRYQTAEEFRDAIQQVLYRMNPTISADLLAQFMRAQFAADLEEERALVASTQKVNVDDFRDQLAGSVTHTITFARAGLFGRKERGPGSGRVSLPSVDGAAISSSVRRTGGFAIAAVAAMLVGGVLTYFVLRKALHPVQQQVVVPAAPVAPKSAAPVVPSEPVITPLGPKDVPKVAKKDADPPRARKAAVRSPKERVGEDAPPPVAPKPHTQEEVSAKFRTVKGEYAAFKGEYGGQLEGDWTAIVRELTFGKADKLDKVDGMLDGLRKSMARIRKGG